MSLAGETWGAPPSAVTDLTAIAADVNGEILLRWTAPGSDGPSGTCSLYEVKYRTAAQIDDEVDYVLSSLYVQLWTPQLYGSLEEKTINGLTPGDTYYWAIKGFDVLNGFGDWSRSGGANPDNFARAQFLSPLSWSTDTGSISPSSIRWAWNDIAEESGYRVFTATGGVISGDLAQDATFYVETGLTPNTTYLAYHQAFEGATALDSPTTTQVTLAAPPDAPTSPSQTTSVISLQWGSGGNPAGTLFDLERSLSGSNPWVVIATRTATSSANSAGLSVNTTYYYRVRAFNHREAPSSYSAALATVTLANAPASLVSPSQMSTSLDLQWSANGNPGGTYYDVERSMDGVGDWIVVSTKSTAVSITDSSLSVNVTYYYRVRAFNHALVPTAYTSQLEKATLANAPNALNSPSQTNTSLALQWGANGNPDGTVYDLERSPNGSSGWSAILSKSTETSATDVALAELTTYYFRVRAFNRVLTATSYSSTLSTATFWIPPSAISSLVATTGGNDGEIDLSWVAPGNDGNTGTVASYLVRYATFNVSAANFSDVNVSTYSQSWPSLQTAGQIENRVLDGFTPAVTYYLAIKGQDGAGAASWDHSANPGRSAMAKDLAPPAPAFSSWAIADHQINIFWNPPSIPDLDGFILDTSTDGFATFTTNIYGPGITSKFSSGLQNETTYFYRLRAFDTPPAVLTSVYSTVLATTTPDTEAPGHVTGFAATQGEIEGELRLTWTMPGDDFYEKDLVSGASFRVKLSTNPSHSWSSSDFTATVSTTASPATTHARVFSGLSAGVTYYARMWVVDEKGNISTLSVGATNWAQVDVTPPSQIAAPTLAPHWHRVDLSWAAPGDDGGTGVLNGRFDVAYSSLSDITNVGEFLSAPGQLSISTSVAPGASVGAVVSGLATGVTYYFSIRALDERGNGSTPSLSSNAYPINAAPAAFSLASPVDNAIVATAQPLFDWADSSDGDSIYGDSISYSIDYSTSNGFEAAISTSVSGLAVSQHMPFALQEDKTIYWRVVVVDADGATAGGSPNPMRVRINVSNSAPAAFNLLSPAHTSQANPASVTLDWEDAIDSDPGDVVSYLVETSTVASFAPLAYSSITAASQLAVSGLGENVTYYWRVTANDSYVNTASSVFWFAVNATPEPPNAFSLVTPTNHQRMLTQTPTLTWQDTLDPDPGGSFTFALFYSTFSNFSSSVTVSLSTTTYTLPVQPDDTNFYWFVRAIDNTGLSRDSSQTLHFYTDLVKEAPAPFQLLTPTNTTVVADLRPVFDWDETADSDPFDNVRFIIELAVNDPTFAGVQGIPTGADSFFIPVNDLIDHTTYYWRVKAGGYQNVPPTLVDSSQTVSAVFSFRIDTVNIPPQPFDLLTPVNGATIDTQSPLFTWSESDDTADDFVIYSVTVATSTDFTAPVASTAGLSALEWAIPGELAERATYYWRVTATDKSSAETIANQDFLFYVPVLTRLRHPNGVTGSFAADLSSGTISWFEVTENVGGIPAIDLAGYHVYRSTQPETAGDDSPFATVGPSVLTWTDSSVGGVPYFYMVRAFDESGIESIDSAVVQAAERPSSYILSPKKNMLIAMDAETSSKLMLSENGIRRLTLTEDEGVSGRVLIGYDIRIEKESDNSVVQGFRFYRPIVLAFSLAGFSSSGAAQAKSAAFDPSQTAIYWFNGVEYVKMGGAYDPVSRRLTLHTAQSGHYQVRQVARATSFEVARIWPSKTFTPNGDGINDVIHFVFENPKDAPVSGKVFNVQGALVANLAAGTDGISLEWDGKYDGGSPAPKGVYIYQIESDGKTLNGTMVVAR